jgi:drug/metabolite transporter (DMT)-like permease
MTAAPLTENRRGTRWRAVYPYLLLAGSQLCWAGNWVVGRAMRTDLPPLALAFWRWTIAALVLAPFALPRLSTEGATLRRSWKLLVLIGISGAGFFQAMVYIGLHYTEVLNSTMMYSASPLFIMLIAALMGVERVSLRQLAGMAVSFCGILVILNRGDLGHLRQFHFNPGDLLILMAMPAWGLYCVLLPRRPPTLDGIAMLFLIATIGAVALAPFYAAESMVVGAPKLGWAALATLLYVGLFASVAAYILWNRGLALVGPNRAGFTNHLLPAFSVILAVTLLGERLRVFHVVGIATILAGIWLATTARTRVRPASPR